MSTIGWGVVEVVALITYFTIHFKWEPKERSTLQRVLHGAAWLAGFIALFKLLGALIESTDKHPWIPLVVVASIIGVCWLGWYTWIRRMRTRPKD